MDTASNTFVSNGIKKTLRFRNPKGVGKDGSPYDFKTAWISREDLVEMSAELAKPENASKKGYDIRLEEDFQSKERNLVDIVKSAIESGNTDNLKAIVASYDSRQARIQTWRQKRNAPPAPVSGDAPVLVPSDKPADAPADSSAPEQKKNKHGRAF